MKKISDIPKFERPREKLLERGVGYLSDLELLAVLIGNGTKDCNVMTVAGRILKVLDRGCDNVSAKELQEIEGVGPAKSAVIAAALEFARRRIRPEGIKITFPSDILPLISYMSDRKQEHFICVSLNGASEVIATRVVSVGLVNNVQVHPREVFADPITDRATAVIVAHNHPSGSLVPSHEDIEVTKRLKEAGDTLGIKLIDHIIFSRKGYFSFIENGQMPK
ncbi:MAG TPA: DNA repair protein RadC [Acetivibrio sp.]|uniref:RadC family protein n=1 Tax=Acetivibrio sp. TaxID=1872092 RepID=UPI002C3B18C6|nr:DNA repair protein RadC [Acetivibrio sp.]HOM02162.1 DNA repair protein RadC [Acetivibrio sp.]